MYKDSRLNDDKDSVERRFKPRFPADYPAVLIPLSDPATAISVLVQDVSETGVRLFLDKSLDWTVDRALSVGEFAQLEIEDVTLFVEVRYRDGPAVGFRVESALIGESDLSRLIEKLLGTPLNT